MLTAYVILRLAIVFQPGVRSEDRLVSVLTELGWPLEYEYAYALFRGFGLYFVCPGVFNRFVEIKQREFEATKAAADKRAVSSSFLFQSSGES